MLVLGRSAWSRIWNFRFTIVKEAFQLSCDTDQVVSTSLLRHRSLHCQSNITCDHLWCVKGVASSFLVPSAQGVIECTPENPGKLKVHFCTTQVHSKTEQTRHPCSMLA